jgi:hypothetical protein
MRRLLTGYAIGFNHRHHRHGHLFQNRYKSILCQEDRYLLELVRYIHLNPLRAKLVKNLNQLTRFAFCGHSVLMGKRNYEWQNVDYILRFYGKTVATARRRYQEFVKEGVDQGRRTDLIGGGLIRSAGGWSAVKAIRQSEQRVKSDERILGDGDFVKNVLKHAQETMERRYALKAARHDFNWLVDQVAKALQVDAQDVLAPGKYPQIVKARSLLCYWAVRELGMTTVELAKRLNLAQPTISQAVSRGQKIAVDRKLRLDNINQ